MHRLIQREQALITPDALQHVRDPLPAQDPAGIPTQFPS